MCLGLLGGRGEVWKGKGPPTVNVIVWLSVGAALSLGGQEVSDQAHLAVESPASEYS